MLQYRYKEGGDAIEEVKEENKKMATLSNSYHPTSNCGDNGD